MSVQQLLEARPKRRFQGDGVLPESAYRSHPSGQVFIVLPEEMSQSVRRHVKVYVRPGPNWTEVQGMWECAHGCKLYVRRRGCVNQYMLFHSTSYGCQLGMGRLSAWVPVKLHQS